MQGFGGAGYQYLYIIQNDSEPHSLAPKQDGGLVRGSSSHLCCSLSGFSQFPRPQLSYPFLFLQHPEIHRALTSLLFLFRRNELHEQEPWLCSHLPGDTQRGYCL